MDGALIHMGYGFKAQSSSEKRKHGCVKTLGGKNARPNSLKQGET